MSFIDEKVIETKQCKRCSVGFEITDKDLEFYDKVSPVFNSEKYSIPTPTLCPDCREQRRLCFRNERKLYKRKCDAIGKDIISVFSPDKGYKVYNQHFWQSDNWDPLDYGIEFDNSKLFFEQFNELLLNIPLPSVLGMNNENSDYTNLVADNKNCYIVFESSNNEDCYYSYWIQKCRDCVDVSFSHECISCFNIDNCFNSYNLKNSIDCENCTNSYFLENCTDCSYCYGCINLQSKKYYICNEEKTKTEYLDFIKNIQSHDDYSDKIEILFGSVPKKYSKVKQIENSKGCYLNNTKNCIECFHGYDSEDCKYGEHIWRQAKDVMDVSTVGRDANLIYESINTGISVYQNVFDNAVWTSNNVLYSFYSTGSSNLFGCIGLKNKQYCILNKQYTKEEYNILVPKIINHMKEVREWGEFFPSDISPFGYNETVAQEYFPLEKQKAVSNNFNWSDYETPLPKVDKVIPASKLPENISDIPNDILNWAIECEITKKPFRIIAQELKFYKKHNLPVPRRHPDQRHLDRMALRSPRKLYTRDCDKCGHIIETTYSPERQEIVYCDECYNKEIY